jgi:hypothetical protein
MWKDLITDGMWKDLITDGSWKNFSQRMEFRRVFITNGMWRDFYNGWNVEGVL